MTEAASREGLALPMFATLAEEQQREVVDAVRGAALAAASTDAVRVWIDLTNSPHVPIFAPLIGRMRARGWEVQVTARAFAQTLSCWSCTGSSTPWSAITAAARGRARRGRRPTGWRRCRVRASRRGSTWRWPTGRPTCRWPPRASRALHDHVRLRVRARCSTGSTRRLARARAGARGDPASRGCAGWAPAGQADRPYPGLLQEYYLADFTPDPAMPAVAWGWTAADRAGRPAAAGRPGALPPVREPLFDGLVQYLGLRGDIRRVVLPRSRCQARADPGARPALAADPRVGRWTATA